MKIFNVPIDYFGVPFNRWWKRLIMHFLISLVVSAIVCSSSTWGLLIYIKFVFLYFFSDITQAFTHILIHVKLEEKFDWLKDTRKRVVYAIILHTLGTFVNYFTVPLLYIHLVFHVPFQESFNILAGLWVIPIAIVGFVMVFGVAGEFLKNWKKSLASEEKLKAEMMNYKYESLRNQINPHFLLDSFNSLKHLVKEDQQKAADFIQKISNLYRHVLQVKDKEFIPLREELEFIEPYIELLKFRYKDQMQISVNVKPEKDDLIAPMSLQFLIENAIENTNVFREEPVHIDVNKMNEHIEISNSRGEATSKIDLMNARLKNIQQQYQFYSDKPVEFVETSSAFVVKLPILKQA